MDWVLLSAAGRLARVETAEPVWRARLRHGNARADHDVITAAAPASGGAVGAVTSRGAAYRLELDDLPRLAPGGPWSLWDGPVADDLFALQGGEHVAGLMSLDPDAPPLALGTRGGVVKRVVPEYKGWETWEVMAVKEDDAIVGLAHAADTADLVFITTDAQLLRLSAREVRAQGRPAGGMAGVKLADDARVICSTAIAREDRDEAAVATLAVGPDAAATVKLTPFADYPAKGRATAGVRTQRFLKGQTRLALAWAGLPPVRACDSTGAPRNLPAADDRRDGTGTKVYGPFFAFG
ncbi:MAG: hypothetical protein LBI33_02285 [Propionibacteriaceae bacterium]|jgi:DNA gyrase subunit A|nr:hypothetical protein [Propionibacteriaceae bacterium]